MVCDDSTTSGRHTARKQAARELAGRTGMNYTEALRHVSDTGARRVSRWRRVLTDEVRRFFAGEGWRNVQIENLYDWLDGLDPVYECDWCAERGDACEVDSSIRLPVNWIELARHHGQVLLCFGPLPQAGELVELPDQLDAVELVDDGVFLVGWVQVTAGNQ